ncbi:hypothetical protein PAXRUDRAFT_793514 [Paxillus rubicundulus Ve08.2h10]|uniref:Uncharacterized protein n=1 Tax=Paxillus rubicundulus Ve08.2h10 TaxID=930991 RepID=A0A0D0DKS3_9AGAM|nr:hypothetical protein PAXRUDRAFT_793514 [Paxillus rubicundulus Ve08.2h10]
MHECILNTFALYLETIEDLPKTHGQWPHGALTLSVVAVEHAFRQWDTSNFIPLSKADAKFLNKLWGYVTDEVMTSVDQILEKK